MSFAKPRLTPKLGRRNTDPISKGPGPTSSRPCPSAAAASGQLPRSSSSNVPSGRPHGYTTPRSTPSVPLTRPTATGPPACKPPMVMGGLRSRLPPVANPTPAPVSTSATPNTPARLVTDTPLGVASREPHSSHGESLAVLALHGEYLQSEWMLAAARDNARQIRHAWDKEHVQIRTALSEALSEKIRQEIELDRWQYLTLFASTKAVENEIRARLVAVLPETAHKLDLAARGLERAQTYFHIQGVSSTKPEAFTQLKTLMESRQGALAEMVHHLQEDNSREMAVLCQEVRANLIDLRRSQGEVQKLVQELNQLSTREASLQFSQADAKNENPDAILDELEFALPPRIPPPKLIDF